MAVAITRLDLSAPDLRREASRTRDADVARRLLVLALVVEGVSRETAARQCGMDRQTLRDWVHRYNRVGVSGLSDLPPPGRPGRLSDEQFQAFEAIVLRGPDPEKDGVVRWRCSDLKARLAAEFGVEYHERSVGKLLARIGMRRLAPARHTRKKMLKPKRHIKKLRRPDRRHSAIACTRQTSGNLVAGRSQGWSTGHVDPRLGQARQPPGDPA